MHKHDHAGVSEGPRLLGHAASEPLRLVPVDRDVTTEMTRNLVSSSRGRPMAPSLYSRPTPHPVARAISPAAVTNRTPATRAKRLASTTAAAPAVHPA